MMPPAATLERLRHLRLTPHHARAGLGPGERRSGQRGAGMEFIEHRPYRPGDDIRDLDHRLMARLGQPFLRQFASDQRLAVSILIDNSPSMATAPERIALATQLAGLLGFVTLAAGDALRFWRGGAHGAERSPLISGLQRADLTFDWLDDAAASQPMAFDTLIAAARPSLPPHGMVILISDWQDPGSLAQLGYLAQAGHEPVVIRLASGQETDPSSLGQGVLVLEDAETGQTVTLAVTPDALAGYRDRWVARTEAIRSACMAGHGYFFDFKLDLAAAELILGPICASGLCQGHK